MIDGKFKNGLGAILSATPQGGYVVGKVSSGKKYAILGVRQMGQLPGPSYSACGSNEVAVFGAPPGGVVYVGTVQFGTATKTGISVSYSDNLKAAHQFVDQNFPSLKGKVVPTERVPLLTTRKCDL